MDLTELTLTEKAGVSYLSVHAKPRAKKSAIVGVREGALDVQVAAPPIEGAANDEIVRFLARAIKVPKTAVTVFRGEGSRHKVIAIAGISPEDLRSRLAAFAG